MCVQHTALFQGTIATARSRPETVLVQVSLSEWNQDERFGAFGGPHAQVMGGYGQLADAMAAGLHDIRYNEPVTEISYTADGATAVTQSGLSVSADAVVVSAPIGVLQKGKISFSPALPEWKTEAFTRIGMGKLNKVSLQAPCRSRCYTCHVKPSIAYAVLNLLDGRL